MHKDIREQLYGLFINKRVRIETKEGADYDNFCCLRITEDPEKGTSLIIGRFSDDTVETLLLAHELGHILHYEELSKEDAEAAYCAILASNHLGLENISPDAKRTVIGIEEKASQRALALLKDLKAKDPLLDTAKDTYNGWIKGYLKKAKLPETDTTNESSQTR